MYSDQTGRFPITSAGGHKYTMVAVELDGNYIDAELMKSRSARELTEGIQTNLRPMESHRSYMPKLANSRQRST